MHVGHYAVQFVQHPKVLVFNVHIKIVEHHFMYELKDIRSFLFKKKTNKYSGHLWFISWLFSRCSTDNNIRWNEFVTFTIQCLLSQTFERSTTTCRTRSIISRRTISSHTSQCLSSSRIET